ncbi:MAG TPA: molybdopterin oxidoreductase [Candidatus Desulfofervidus auxilii]|uniref:Molybdopterin oxidoreductase n=1 Tax=Desulfofervidus auxilii TaxID=1621989 RepID=A0A7V0IA84_DESA2|nr:molybdopterin oxidoreductase [Candidatus Desulfofervidus auxilii]
MDRALIPPGVERCSFKKFLIWLSCVGIVLVWGLYAMFLCFAKGLNQTNLTNYFGFGIWITLDLAVIALGAGAFFSGFLRYIIGVDELKNIINLAVIVGWICYGSALMVLGLDVGQPLRGWHIFWYANVHSMLTEVAFCISTYFLVLCIEYLPIILENPQLDKNKFIHIFSHNLHEYMFIFAAVGTFLSFFHQGSLGGVFGVLYSRPFSFREGFFVWPWTFFLFILSAIASGPAFTLLVAWILQKATGRKLVKYNVLELMGKIAGTLLCVYLILKFADTYYWATHILPEKGMTLTQCYQGWFGPYGLWLLVAELGIFGVIPALILISPLRKKEFFLIIGALFDCIGIVINRFVFTVQTSAVPTYPFDKWVVYSPSWQEWATSIMVVALGVLVISLSYRYLPLFPQEKELNP